MNSRTLSLLLSTLLLIVLAAVPVHANTIYSYVGNPYTFVADGEPSIVHPQFTTSQFVTFQLTMSRPLGPNLINYVLVGVAPIAPDTPLLTYSANNGICSLSEVKPTF